MPPELSAEPPVSDARADANTVIANETNHPTMFVAREDTSLIGPEYGYYDIRAEFTPPGRVHEKTPADFTWD